VCHTGHSGIEGVDCRPLASAFLTSLIQNFSNKWLAVVVLEAEDVAGDLDQEGIEDALIPSLENLRNLLLIESESALQDIVCLSDELHITIFDSLKRHRVHGSEYDGMNPYHCAPS
jgi:hypothetical protein